MQIGAEAIMPASRLTGHGYGGVVQLHFYLDDLFPNSIGRPLITPSDINKIVASAAHEWIAGPTEAVIREALSSRFYH
jgi:hypothetical protein